MTLLQQHFSVKFISTIWERYVWKYIYEKWNGISVWIFFCKITLLVRQLTWKIKRKRNHKNCNIRIIAYTARKEKKLCCRMHPNFFVISDLQNLLTGLGQCQNSIPRLELVEDSNAQCAILSCMVLIVLELHKLHAKLKFLGHFLHAKLQNHC